jgi:hypothetical protein
MLFSPERKPRGARNHRQLSEAGEFSDDVLGNAITEVLMLRIT